MMALSLPDGSRLEVVEREDGNMAIVSHAGTPPPPTSPAGAVRWHVPFTRVHEATVAGAPKDALWVDVSCSPVAYYAALRDIWERGESFALLEHDVVCRPDVVEAFEDCPEPWCSYGYSDICCQDETGYSPCQEAWANQLGCVRFRSELIAAVPDAMSAIPADNWDWHNVCDGLGANLRAAGFSHHWHFPPVEHHHMGRHD